MADYFLLNNQDKDSYIKELKNILERIDNNEKND